MCLIVGFSTGTANLVRFPGRALVILAIPLAAFIFLAVVVTRWSRLRYLGPNVNAVALATPAPAGPVAMVRSAASFVSGATLIALALTLLAPLAIFPLRVAVAEDEAAVRIVSGLVGGLITAMAATAIAGVVGYFVLARGPAGARRQLGVIDAAGIRIHHLRLTVPWRDVRKLNGNDEGGVDGVGIWLIDPARTLASAELSPWRRWIFLRNVPAAGWLRLPAKPLTIIPATAMHRTYLNQHEEAAA